MLCYVVLLTERCNEGLFDLFEGWVVVRVVLLTPLFDVIVIHSCSSEALRVSYHGHPIFWFCARI